MRTAQVTQVSITPSAGVNGFRVEIAWRYGNSGSFMIAAASALVNQAGILTPPVNITYDETINPVIQIRTTYRDALGCPPKYVDFTAGAVETTPTPPPTTITTTTTVLGGAPTTVGTTTTNTTVANLVQWAWMPTDPYNALQTADNISYQPGVAIAANPPSFQANLSGMPGDYYAVVRVPSSVSIKTVWFESNFNNGQIPDQIWRAAFTLRGYTYYVTRIPATFSNTATDRVTFS